MSRPATLFPALRRIKTSGQFYYFHAGRRRYLGNDEPTARAKHRAEVAALVMASGGVGSEQVSPAGPLTTHPAPAAPSLLVAEALAKYLDRGITHRDSRSRGHAREACMAVRVQFGGLPIEAFRVPQVEAVRDSLLTRKKKRGGQPYSRNYVNRLVAEIRQAWRWLALRDYAPADTAAKIGLVRAIKHGRGGREIPDRLPAASLVVDATLPYLSASVGNMVRVQRLTGMRPGEIVSMRRRELSIHPGERVMLPTGGEVAAQVVDGAIVWAYAPSQHKCLSRGKHRIVMIGPAAQRILRPLLDRDYLFPATESGKPGRKGKHYSAVSYGRAVANACKRHGLPPWTLYQLRHLWATETRDSLGDDAASAGLGHSSAAMLDTYTRTAIGAAARAAAKAG